MKFIISDNNRSCNGSVFKIAFLCNLYCNRMIESKDMHHGISYHFNLFFQNLFVNNIRNRNNDFIFRQAENIARLVKILNYLRFYRFIRIKVLNDLVPHFTQILVFCKWHRVPLDIFYPQLFYSHLCVKSTSKLWIFFFST